MTEHENDTQVTEHNTECKQVSTPQRDNTDTDTIDDTVIQSTKCTDAASSSMKITKRIKNALQSAWIISKSFSKGPDKIANIAVREKDYSVSIVLALALVISFFLFNLFLDLSLLKATANLLSEIDFFDYGTEGMLHFEFGRILLFSLVFPLVVCGTYVLINSICQKATGYTAGLTIFEHFIEFSVFSIPVSVLLPIAGLFFFISPSIGMIITATVLIYLLTTCIFKISTMFKNDLFSIKNLFLSTASALMFIGIILITLISGILWYLGLSELLDMLKGLLYYANF